MSQPSSGFQSSIINLQSSIHLRTASAFFIMLFTLALSAQTNLSLLGRKTYAEDLSDVWGYAANGREYALVGLYSGVSIVDVTNPSAPVQLFFVNTAQSNWHDIATWNGCAYVTNETGGGLTVINLNYLPDSIQTITTTGGSLGLTKAHTIFCDENGIIYVAGGNSSAGRGVLMFDAASNPTNPPLVGRYDVHYVHDVFVRGDTMWTAEINDGIYAVVDVSNKNNPVILADNFTPNRATHNVWLSDDGRILLTTDEVNNAYITAYDVSDLGNIRQLDLFQFNPGSNSTPHNVQYLHDFAVASYYRDGVVIIDASDPQNLVAVGNYDTSPLSGAGYNGCWSVYPYLPSGNILASDIEQGLFVLAPLYRKACYLEGMVFDLVSGLPLNNVTVTILPSNPADFTDALGKYKTGIADSGKYSAQFTKSGYQTYIENNVVLKNGIVTILNVRLIPAFPVTLTGSVVDAAANNGIPYSQVLIKNSVNSYLVATDSLGNFRIDSFETGDYRAFAGKWGFVTQSLHLVVTSDSAVSFTLLKGYYDDYVFDFGWTITGTAASGRWVRENPAGTVYNNELSNPEDDVPSDFGEDCFVTGNGGGQAGSDDVDDGTVTLVSPPFDLSAYFDPYLSYYRWFFNAGGSGSPDDTLFVMLTNGTETQVIDFLTAGNGNNSWNKKQVRVKDFLLPSPALHLIFETSDNPGAGHVVEAAVDMFSVFDSLYPPSVNFISNKSEGCPGDTFVMQDLSLYQPQSWMWQFPGGIPSTSTEQNPSVVYPNAGTYRVTLLASNAGGSASLTISSFITIRELPSTYADIIKTSDSLSHDGSLSLHLSGNSPFMVQWSNGSTDSVLQNLAAGDYSVTVTDSFGCRITETFTVHVIPTQPPVVDFISDRMEGCPNDTFTMTDLSVNLPQSWLWEFPGGIPSVSTSRHPAVVFPNAGEYDVTLTVTNDAGTATATRQSFIIVHESPNVSFTISDASSAAAADGFIGISVTGNPPFQFQWSNGSSDSILTNIMAGDYSLTVTNIFGCKNSDTVTVGFGTFINCPYLTLQYFPNPFTREVTVKSNTQLELSFYNSLGKKTGKVYLSADKKILWGENQLPGIYFMVISSGMEPRTVAKLVKIK